MKNYEVTFIVDPVLSGDELKSTVSSYASMLEAEGCKIVATNEMGLRQLAYDINKRSSGIYYCIEFNVENGLVIDKLELALRRDERIMRFLTVALDKFGVQYNADKRAGKIGKAKSKPAPAEAETTTKPVAAKTEEKSESIAVAAPVAAPVVAPVVATVTDDSEE